MPLNKNLGNGVDIPTDDDYDGTPYFDYHHLKAIENVSFFFLHKR